jgi:hypothetical protein
MGGMLLGLVTFGILYNWLVAYLKARGYDEGYMGFIVAGGVIGTLAGMALLNSDAAGLGLVAFSASGLPMLAGSWWRHVRARRNSQELAS